MKSLSKLFLAKVQQVKASENETNDNDEFDCNINDSKEIRIFYR